MIKGIVLAGGAGNRLHPITNVVNKHLLPIYDKPLIYYPLSTLVAAGAREILIVTTPRDRPAFEELLGDGRSWGLSLSYAVQPHPGGLAQAFSLGRDFLEGRGCALILGDNLFLGGPPFEARLRAAADASVASGTGATVFVRTVPNPRDFGVVELGPGHRPLSIEEKPARPRSRYAVTGLYLYDARAVVLAARLEPSARGEAEITDLNRLYLNEGRLKVVRLPSPVVWIDAGTHETLLRAGNLVRRRQRREGRPVGCPPETSRRLAP